MKHTGGNWKRVGFYIFSDTGDKQTHIATIMSSLDNSPNKSEQNANADLIVMAPRMYDALKLAKIDFGTLVGLTNIDSGDQEKVYGYITDILEELECT